MADLRTTANSGRKATPGISPNQNRSSVPYYRRSEGEPSNPLHPEHSRSRSPRYTPPGNSVHCQAGRLYPRCERTPGSSRRSPTRSSMLGSLNPDERMMAPEYRPGPRKYTSSSDHQMPPSWPADVPPRSYRPHPSYSRPSPGRHDGYRPPRMDHEPGSISPGSSKDFSRDESSYVSPRSCWPPNELRSSVAHEYHRHEDSHAKKGPPSWIKEIEALENRLDELAQENLGLRIAFIDLAAKGWRLGQTVERALKIGESIDGELFPSVPKPLRDGNLFVVDCHALAVENVYRSITAALLEATSGSNIAVKQGIYVESLILKLPVRIFGVGIDVTISTEKETVITSLADDVTLENLRIKCDGDNTSMSKNKVFNCIFSCGKNLRLDGCDLISSRGYCLCVDTRPTTGEPKAPIAATPDGERSPTEQDHAEAVEPSATALCVDSRLNRAATSGLYARGSASVTLDRCEIDSCSFSGIEAREKAKVKVQRSRILNSGKTGLLIRSGAHLTLESSDVMNSGMAGIEISRQAECHVSHSRIFFGCKNGVFVHEMGRAVLNHNQIFNNRMSNIDVRQGGKVSSTNNVLSDSSAAGVYVAQTAECTLSLDTITRNASNGVEVTRGKLMCSNAKVTKNGRFGICGNEESELKVFKTDLRFNKKGPFDGQTEVFEDNKDDEV